MFISTGSSSFLPRLATVITFTLAIFTQPYTQAQERITVTLSADGKQIQTQWMNRNYTIEAQSLRVNVLDALDCSQLRRVEQLSLTGQRFIGTPTIDLNTNSIAIGVLLSECVETQQSAVVVIKPQPQGYTTSLVQVPGKRPLNNEFSTYPMSSLIGLQYWDNLLLVRQGDAASNQALLVYSVSESPGGQYKGCLPVEIIEGTGLCPK
ncbi:hypothetical protein PCC7424_3311 [Gloeothece citriformis PCC 7424]|uniref:Uncharacterized protein n=1 Tax=Gloeothece citriformis (strain PCC 7424) TaxID=65393 RepID=B7KE12_GLOC7|nr:hypothetical protein [Gloeothece citriformis]ACK71710.1 hypothetical protein PCC7424_3311 [Gloeothece citriformis PCC 7424]